MFRAAFLPIIRSSELYIGFGTFYAVSMNRLLPLVGYHPTPGSIRSQLHKMYQSRCTAKNSWWWAERLPETCVVVIPIKLVFSASVGFIHKAMRKKKYRNYFRCFYVFTRIYFEMLCVFILTFFEVLYICVHAHFKLLLIHVHARFEAFRSSSSATVYRKSRNRPND
jgi:hypothetical protein